MSEQIFNNGNCAILTQLYGWIGHGINYEDYKRIEDIVNAVLSEEKIGHLQKEINELKARLEEIRMITRRRP